MTHVLAHPFRLSADGSAATVDDRGDQFVEQTLSVLVRTPLFERPMAWAWGVPSLAHTGLTAADMQVVLDQYGPDVRVRTTSTPVDDQTTRVEVEWSRVES